MNPHEEEAWAVLHIRKDGTSYTQFSEHGYPFNSFDSAEDYVLNEERDGWRRGDVKVIQVRITEIQP